MNILITGASGLIGSQLLQKMDKENHNIYCQSRNHHDHPTVKWIKHNLITDSWEDLPLPHLDIVYYLASQTKMKVISLQF